MTLITRGFAPSRVAIIGLGQQGIGVAELLGKQGHQLVGGVDIGPKVGKKISEFVHGVADDALIHGSVAKLIEAIGEGFDVAVLAAAIDRETTLAQARELLSAGVNVLTLHQDLFEPLPEWADELDAIGQSTGASLLATGVQDTWWVQMPAVAAASTNNIRGLQIEHLIDLDSISVSILETWGIGVAASDFGPYKDTIEKLPPILGAPLRLAARSMGLVPGTLTTAILPIVATEPTMWKMADRELPVGTVVGTEEVTTIATEEGVEFRGYLRLRALKTDEQPSDILTIEGDPALRLEHTPFPGQQVTNIALVARIPDIVEAPGGVHSVADLGPAKYFPPVSS